jgi:hypothetical protein
MRDKIDFTLTRERRSTYLKCERTRAAFAQASVAGICDEDDPVYQQMRF